MEDIIEKRINTIAEDEKVNAEWQAMKTLAYDMRESLAFSKYASEINIVISPNDMGSGSIGFHTSALPHDVLLKVWYNGGYYAAFFKRVDAYFDHIITHTINESGIMPLTDMDEAEERILDFIANDLYKKNNTIVLRAEEAPNLD